MDGRAGAGDGGFTLWMEDMFYGLVDRSFIDIVNELISVICNG